MPWVGLALRLSAAAIWLFFGAAKLTNLPHFHDQVEAYKLLPGSLTAPFAYALPFVEVGVGLYLLVGLFVRATAILSCVMMLAFIVAMAQAYARGLSVDCGCAGTLYQQKVGILSILRDGAFGLPSLAMALWPARLLSLDATWLGLPDRFGRAGSGREAAELV